MKINDLRTHEEVLASELQEPEFRAEWERTRFADAVATRVIAYRAEHGVTQTELAKQLGMSQSAVARLEAGDHEPTVATLARLSRRLGMSFHINITPDHEPELTA
jgi:DNA-binding XRE family transcriptional regulator